MTKTASIRATAAAYQQVTTDETWCRLWAREEGVPFRIVVSATLPDPNVNDFVLWHAENRKPFELSGLDNPVWVRADGPPVTIDIVAGTISGGDFQWLQGLFANGEQGGLWVPSRRSGQYQVSTPATPITADGQPLGYSQDFSGNGHHLIQATSGNRPDWRNLDGLQFIRRDSANTAERLQAPGTASSFKFLHGGGDFTLAMAVRFEGGTATCRIGTSASTAGAGVGFGPDVTNRRWRFAMGNGASNIANINPVSPITVDGDFYSAIAMMESGNLEVWINSVSIGTATPTGFSASDSPSDFSLPIQTSIQADFFLLTVMDRALTSDERAEWDAVASRAMGS